MRAVLPLMLIVATAAGVATAQEKAQDKSRDKKSKVVSLTGCVEPESGAPDQYTITDTKEGSKYRITGMNFREYLNRPVQVDGGIVVKGLKISGGLLPNANIAGQAGAIDPSRAAVQAATNDSGTGAPVDIPEFKVKTIKPASGDCPTP